MQKAVKSFSTNGANELCTGFGSEQKLYDHVGRYGPKFGTKDPEEYLQRGIEFLTKPCDGDIIGYACSDGKIVRFNQKTCEYASGYPEKKLCTYMIPKIRKRDLYIDPQKALNYYEQHKEDDLNGQ